MLTPGAHLLDLLDRHEPAIWVCVADTKGSVPRESGASMIVTRDEARGTIGGGHLELKAIEFARAQCLANAAANATASTLRHFPLGPALGQCCGGAVSVLFVPVVAAMRDELTELARMESAGGIFYLVRSTDTGERVHVALEFTPWPVCVFGAGHVGKAIVEVMSALPCTITWIDEREAEFPAHAASNVTVLASNSPADEVATIASGAQVLVLTHSHALDLAICFALLVRTDHSYCGLIGSATKAATFRRRFAQRGITANDASRIMCPIGEPSLTGKHPGVIAVGVAADLTRRHQLFLESKRLPGLVA